MELNEYNQKAINDVYKNAHIALQSISDLIPAVEDDDIKSELVEEYEGYEKIIGKISTFMAENKIEPQDINPLKKAMLWSSIKMKTLFNNSRNQVAEMMINGTVMGINELTAMKNEGENFEYVSFKGAKMAKELALMLKQAEKDDEKCIENYGYAFEVYSIALILSSYSMPLAVSKLLSARFAKGEYLNGYRIFKGF